MNTFFKNLPHFKLFNEITNDQHFQIPPSDWSLVITDVKGSTQAIKEGRYKDVNTLGAASIVVAKKRMKKEDFPFVFGGDGATMLIPPSEIEGVLEDLCSLKELAKVKFGLDLRVGRVLLDKIYQEGKKVEVAKNELTAGKSIAILRGNGVGFAEGLIKNPNTEFEIKYQTSKDPDLTGLTCRWQPIPSKRGKILTLIVEARNESNSTYDEILKKIDNLFPEGIETLNPAITELGKYKSILSSLREEARFQKSVFSVNFIKRLFEIIPAYLVFNYKIPLPNILKYTKAMSTHSDFRKFDSTLRMVIDCSPEKVLEIQTYLDALHQDGKIFYGLLESDNSLMTCFVEGLGQGEHLHFIDAENGGYASAAVKLKLQSKAALTASN